MKANLMVSANFGPTSILGALTPETVWEKINEQDNDTWYGLDFTRCCRNAGIR